MADMTEETLINISVKHDPGTSPERVLELIKQAIDIGAYSFELEPGDDIEILPPILIPEEPTNRFKRVYLIEEADINLISDLLAVGKALVKRAQNDRR